MVSIAGALTRIKNQPLEIDGILDARAVENVFAEQGHQWRDRTLGPAQTVELFIRQVMDGNESCAQVRQHAGGAFSAGAYCAARGRLPVTAMWDLCRRVGQQLRDDHQDALPLWHGHRTFHLDGTSFSMPDTPELQAAFGQPTGQKPGCGFPIAHLLVSFDTRTGMLLEPAAAPLYTHDLRDAHWIHGQLERGDTLIGDKAFGSWAHLALLQSAGIGGVFPLHQRRAAGSRNSDGVETWPKPKYKPAWMEQEAYDALPERITVRGKKKRGHSSISFFERRKGVIQRRKGVIHQYPSLSRSRACRVNSSPSSWAILAFNCHTQVANPFQLMNDPFSSSE